MKVLIFIITIILSACSSVPYSTMLHFSNTKPDDFFNVNPAGIIVKVSVNNITYFDPTESISLSASIEDGSGKEIIVFPLEIVNKTTQPAREGLFSRQPAIDVYLLRLTSEAISNLAIFHQLKREGIPKKVGLSAGLNFSNGPENRMNIDESTAISVALQLTAQDEFITLIDGWKVKAGIE